MISPGACVKIRQHGDIAYIVHRRDMFAARLWLCVCKAVARGRAPVHNGIVAGEGDIIIVREAPTFSPGQQVRFNGGIAEVIEDHGDIVTLAIPPARFKTRAGDHLHVPPSRAVADKGNLVLEELT
jgi:hypothetical protein